ncbi:unnamed protein product [Rotaria magnacalcarata]|uniref:RING-type domain-containing protein n=1 Tax=Rotaria magnacalcarata TaxID=392030 RepID=A0A819I8M3_9BILA|nr:unnamed protein product [Rotaria magnacalcarata]CAF3899799.1 unnamed protein product [Rotaria magnacalcarata]CAF3903405.1 unnamed protein product [Rotaria magnacalcarata]CAF3908245.1 unnamed protein product [Rotaria magnacalcarata]CAF3987349.1 unnamed protein product [Rotaria magnacalcarata]
MATSIQSTKHIVPSSSISRTSARLSRRLKPDLYRLATFRTWKTNTQCIVSPAVLTKVGFAYTGKGDKVRCEACGLEIDNWKPGMDPKQEHIMQKPECPFVLDQHELFSKTDQPISFMKPAINQTNVKNSDYRGFMDHGGGDSNNKSRENLFIFSLSTEILDKTRTYTLSNWPSITPSAQEMSYAGWWYTNIADRVICIHCDVMFHNWNESDRPYEIHRLKSPHCFFVRTNEQRVTNTQQQLPVPIVTANDVPNAQTVVGAVHADYAVLFRRHQTFHNWPEAEKPSLPSVESFIEAGFFYTGENTVVRCFYCNGALRNWQASDDPKIEHARWFPQCAYIRQFIGENLYQAIQRKNRELRAQQNLQESNSGETSLCTPWTNDEIDRMVKARLDLPVVEKLRQENYSMAIIRKVYEMQLRFKKDDFKSDVDLRIACLILDKQVKLINGNEANILVPQNWMHTYIEDQRPNNEPRPAATKQTTMIPKLEPPQVITTIAPRPRLMAKTGIYRYITREILLIKFFLFFFSEEPTLCLLCLSTERQVACLPCGHLTSCVACGHSLKTCPICRAAVRAFVRIYT